MKIIIGTERRIQSNVVVPSVIKVFTRKHDQRSEIRDLRKSQMHVHLNLSVLKLSSKSEVVSVTRGHNGRENAISESL